MAASWRGTTLVTVRIVLLAFTAFSCVKLCAPGITAFLLFLLTYCPLFYVNSKVTVDIAPPLSPAELLSSWKKRKRVDQKSIRAINDWFSAKGVDVLERFRPVRQTQCSFAQKAKLWASPSYVGKSTATTSDLSHYIESRVMDSFLVFSTICDTEELDGFVIEVPKLCSQDEVSFASAVNRILTTLSAASPSGRDCMANLAAVGRKGWVFEFNFMTFFITTFAPFHPPTNSRFGFGIEYGYILLQPELSFARNDIPFSPSDPKRPNIRQHIFDAFLRAGRPYCSIDPTASVAEHTVYDSTGDSMKWWLY